MCGDRRSSRDFSPHYKYPTRLRKPANRARIHFWGGSAPCSHALNVARLIPSIAAVRRSLSLDSSVYRPNAFKTSSVVINAGRHLEKVGGFIVELLRLGL